MPEPIKYERGWRVNFTHNGRKYRKRFPGQNKRIVEQYIREVLMED